MAQTQKLDFTGINVEAMTGKPALAWKAYKAAQEKAQPAIDKANEPVLEARAALENIVASALMHKQLIPQGKVAKFAYRFGGMAFAVADAAGQGKTSSSKVTL
jgi:hypothetical protein